jgi:hypothetical protein
MLPSESGAFKMPGWIPLLLFQHSRNIKGGWKIVKQWVLKSQK